MNLTDNRRTTANVGDGRLRHHDPLPPTAAERALAGAEIFCGTIPQSVSGNGGHDQLFKVVCTLVTGFKLSPTSTWKLMLDYNQRCQPRWSKAELVHKFADAFKLNDVHFVEADLMVSLPFSATAATGDDSDFITPVASASPIQRAKPSRTGFDHGTDVQLQRLAALRGISIAGLRWAQERGVLVFGSFAGHQVYGITDQTGAVLEVRRVDGRTFPAIGNLADRKSHALRGTCKRHPVGINEAANCTHVIVTEGIPDFLAAHDLILRAQSSGVTTPLCAPVALLSANVILDESVLPIFKGKFVRILYHNDVSGAGWKGARRWQQQIVKAGAFSCDFFHFHKIADATIKDLNDYIVVVDAGQLGSGYHALEGFWP